MAANVTPPEAESHLRPASDSPSPGGILPWLLPTVTLVIGEGEVSPQVIQNPALRDFVSSEQVHLPGTTRPTTDDWPYLYLKHAEIPKLHLVVSAAILVAVLAAG